MFGGFGGNGDPFGRGPFDAMQRQMRAMDNMMNVMMDDAFSMLDGFGQRTNHPMLTNGNMRHNDPFGMMMPHNPFGVPAFFPNMNQALNDPNSMVISQSTMMTYDGSGQPRIVQESTRKAGNAKETRRAVRDGEQEHLSVGHTLFDKTHIIEKKRDKAGRAKQSQRFINMDQDEAEAFNDEFRSQAKNFFYGKSSSRGNNKAIEGGKKDGRKRDTDSYNHGTSTPIITIPDDDEDDIPTTSNKREGGNPSRNYSSGPTIQEIVDDDSETSNNKRRKGVLGKFM